MTPPKISLDQGILDYRRSQVQPTLPQLPTDPHERVQAIGDILAQTANCPYENMHQDIARLKEEFDRTMIAIGYRPPRDNIILHPTYTQRTA